MKNHYIYTFTKPTSGEIVYVGRSCQKLPLRFKKHISHLRTNRYVRNPFRCLLTSLYRMGYTPELLLKQFSVVQNNLSLQEAIDYETKLIERIGIDNLTNVVRTGAAGGDTFTNHPDKELIREKLRRRIPWNKGTVGLQPATKTSYKPDLPRVVYTLTSPDGQTFNLVGLEELRRFCKEWTEQHKAVWVKDPNWLSPTNFQLGKNTKGWNVLKVTLPRPTEY